MTAPRVQVTHADRVMFPSEGITKGELVEHYERAAPLMLKQLRDRPLTLQRFPRGVRHGPTRPAAFRPHPDGSAAERAAVPAQTRPS